MRLSTGAPASTRNGTDASSATLRLADAAVLCVGDAMLDVWVHGRVDRISPEAPVPVVRVLRETRVLGGAGNVARNLASLGARAVLAAVCGEDTAGRELRRLVAGEPRISGRIVVEAGRETTCKERFLADGQHLIRADRETVHPLGARAQAELIAAAERALPRCGALLLSDYAKGVLAPDTAAALIAAARRAGKPVVVDPKGGGWSRWRGATVVKPNRRELVAAFGADPGDEDAIAAAAAELAKRHEIEAVLVTLGAAGMMLVRRGGVLRLSATAVELYDVSGAGDTVAAVIAAAIASGIDLEEGCALANAAAGLVVAKVGTAAVRADELAAALTGSRAKPWLVDLDAAAGAVEGWRRHGMTIGLATGRFDVLHPGHAHLIAHGQASCDRLVVALEDDAAAARRGAPPVHDAAHRASVVAAMSGVALVVLATEREDIVETLRPDVLVAARPPGPEAEALAGWGGKFIEVGRLHSHGSAATSTAA